MALFRPFLLAIASNYLGRKVHLPLTFPARGYYEMQLRNFLIIAFLLLSFFSCSSDGNQEITINIDPSGEWTVRFNSISDECELLPIDTNTFEDDHFIGIDGPTILLSSAALPLAEYIGEFRSENSFITSAELEGDLFEQGFNCSLSESIAYNNLLPSEAQIVYEVKIVCDNGSRCDSLLRGYATR